MTEITLHTPDQAHGALAKLWLTIKNELLAGRKQVIILQDYQDKLSTQQRKYYHGFVLNEVAKQASVQGRHYGLQIWKEHFRDKYLGDEIVTEINPMTGIETKRTKRKSSEDLKVPEYNILIEQVTAFASNDLNVNFYQDFDSWLADNEAIRLAA